jgi:hypothetical protein
MAPHVPALFYTGQNGAHECRKPYRRQLPPANATHIPEILHRTKQGKAMDAVQSPNKLSVILTKITAAISTLLGMLWAIITYVFPDPSVFGFSVEFLNWKTMIIIVSTFVLLGAFLIAWQARRLPQLLKNSVFLLLALMLSGAFFRLGNEYAKPSFEFARSQKLFVENDNANLFGKRAEMIDNVRIELLECEQNGQSPTCTLELTNKNADRDFRLTSATSLFEEAGGALNLYQMRVGESKVDRSDAFQLIRNVPTRLTLVFESARSRVKLSPTLKLTIRDREYKDNVLKFNDVKIN